MTIGQMRAPCVLLLGILSLGLWAAGPNTREKLRDPLSGIWRLGTIETIGAHGEVICLFYGEHPEGLLMYDKSGGLSVRTLSDPRPTVSLETPAKSSSPLPPLKEPRQLVDTTPSLAPGASAVQTVGSRIPSSHRRIQQSTARTWSVNSFSKETV